MWKWNQSEGMWIDYPLDPTPTPDPGPTPDPQPIVFDGSDDYVLIAGPNSGPLNTIGTGDFTIEAWVYIISFATLETTFIIIHFIIVLLPVKVL